MSITGFQPSTHWFYPRIFKVSFAMNRNWISICDSTFNPVAKNGLQNVCYFRINENKLNHKQKITFNQATKVIFNV